MKLSERTRNIFTRFSIAAIVVVIVGIYYLSEIKPFPYEGYEKDINRIERYDAELNESVVQIRFGAVKEYDPIFQALDRIRGVVTDFNNVLKEHPNPTIKKKLDAFEKVVKEKEDLTEKFGRINPVLINALNQFAKTLAQIIDAEANNQLIEGSSVESYRPILLEKCNDLFRNIFLYVNLRDEERGKHLINVVKELRSAPQNQKFPDLDLALNYADKILELQPQLTVLDDAIFQIPLVPSLNALNDAYHQAADNFRSQGDAYRIILYVLVFVLLVVLRWAFSRLRGMVTILNIEVQRKIKAEKELEAINRQLEQRVADRTRELTVKNNDLNQALGDLKEAQDQLIMQEKMASVGMLTTGIAHEIKNPLNFVNNFSDISIDLVSELNEELDKNKEKIEPDSLGLIQDVLNDLKTNCAKIKEHGVRADNIVKTMLMHSQEAGVQKEMIEINVLMDDNIQIALESFRNTQGKFDIKLEKIYDEKLDKILVAPQTMARVFTYIIDNALYAVKEKSQKGIAGFEPMLTITLHQQAPYMIIKIKDNGSGIPKKNLDKVFEPFFTTKPTGKGNTGLGLSICYDTVVKQHKGELRVASEEDVFTEFTIMLPLTAPKS